MITRSREDIVAICAANSDLIDLLDQTLCPHRSPKVGEDMAALWANAGARELVDKLLVFRDEGLGSDRRDVARIYVEGASVSGSAS